MIRAQRRQSKHRLAPYLEPFLTFQDGIVAGRGVLAVGIGVEAELQTPHEMEEEGLLHRCWIVDLIDFEWIAVGYHALTTGGWEVRSRYDGF